MYMFTTHKTLSPLIIIVIISNNTVNNTYFLVELMITY